MTLHATSAEQAPFAVSVTTSVVLSTQPSTSILIASTLLTFEPVPYFGRRDLLLLIRCTTQQNTNIPQFLPPRAVLSAPGLQARTSSSAPQLQDQAEQKPVGANGKVTKDARVTKDGTLALTRPQINIANRVLTTKYAS